MCVDSKKIIRLKAIEAKFKRMKSVDSLDSIVSEFQEAIEIINELQIKDVGGKPNPLRYPGQSTKELKLRNRLGWLRTLQLGKEAVFIVTHFEPTVYYATGPFRGDKKGHPADLLGIWHKGNKTELCVAELKAGEKGENIIYATYEGLRNAMLHFKAKDRLREGWQIAIRDKQKKTVKNTNERGFWKNVWSPKQFLWSPKQSPGRGKVQVLVIGDSEWINAQSNWKKGFSQVRTAIKKTIPYIEEVSVYSVNKEASSNSVPYMLLPLQRWDKR